MRPVCEITAERNPHDTARVIEASSVAGAAALFGSCLIAELKGHHLKAITRIGLALPLVGLAVHEHHEHTTHSLESSTAGDIYCNWDAPRIIFSAADIIEA